MNPHIPEMYITTNGEKISKNAENNCYPMTKKRFLTLKGTIISFHFTPKKQLSFAAQIHEKMKLNIQLITAAVLSIGGLVLLFCGVYIDPQGQIHETLLIGFGEVATFAGAIMGVDYTYKRKNDGDNTPSQAA